MKSKKSKTNKKTAKHEIVVRVQAEPTRTIQESDLAPEKEGGKYMIPKTWMSERQVLKMVQKTPEQHVYTRPAKGGGTWKYVTGSYVEKVLNYTFGWNWDFEVQSHGREQDQVWVLGKLTVKDDKGHEIKKTQFGRADVKFKKGSKEMMDYGNDLKAATTDALKKCASLLGIASDIYGKMEIKAETGHDIPPSLPASNQAPKAENVPLTLKSGQVVGPDGRPTYICSKCADPITDEVANYSLKVHGKRLCREDQPKRK